jgi:hypothetical protein
MMLEAAARGSSGAVILFPPTLRKIRRSVEKVFSAKARATN